MKGWIGYSLGYDAGRSDERIGNSQLELVHNILYGERPVTVDQLYIDRLHATLAEVREASVHNYDASNRLYAEGFEWKQKAYQFRDEALYCRDQRFAPATGKIKALREENAALRARLEKRNPDLSAEQDAHQKTHEKKQSLQCFRLVATAILDALLEGRADRPEFGELVAMVKEAAEVIDLGGPFFGFSETPEKAERLDALTDALARP